MAVAALVLKFIQTLIWPSIVLVVLLLFRPQLAGFLKRIQNLELEIGNIKAHITTAAVQQDANAELTEATASKGNLVEYRADIISGFVFNDVVKSAAEIVQPKVAIARAFVGLANAVSSSVESLKPGNDAIEANGSDSVRLRYDREVKILGDAHLISGRLERVLNKLADIYDQQDRGLIKVDESLAQLYIQTASTTSQVLATITGGTESQRKQPKENKKKSQRIIVHRPK